MKKLVLILVFVITATICYAQESSDDNKNELSFNPKDVKGANYNFITITGKEVRNKDFKLGPGMEVTTIKGVNIVAPKGTRAEDKGSWIKVEDLGEFLGRRFDEIQIRLEQVEKQQAILFKELQELKKNLDELHNSSKKSE